MKVIIIGGGIAGLSQGIFLKANGYEVVVYERNLKTEGRGHAFLINEHSIELLKSYIKKDIKLSPQKVDLFSFNLPDKQELINIPLKGWYCLKRIDLISSLSEFYDSSNLIYGKSFSHFLYKNGQVEKVVFQDGTSATADFFIGADGSNSKTRASLFGKTEFTAVEVKEIVGYTKFKINSESKIFTKYQSREKGLSFGYIPVNDDEIVWFIQYDVRFEEQSEINNPENLKLFCHNLLIDFPEVVHQILNSNNFSNTYIWNTFDFDLLPSFHKDNVVLIGDAAHLALPFTSAGTSNAINDAEKLTQVLLNSNNLEEAFSRYYSLRSPIVMNHTQLGRVLKNRFLNPEKDNEKEINIPLIPDDENLNKNSNKKLNIAYFTDPICSTCWIFQPIIRKLILEYKDSISFSYHMGGLLHSWEKYSSSKINSPKDAAELWDELSKKHKVPMDGDVWIEDPLDSSLPPSLAFKAAQIQDYDKALTFLRILREMLFIEKKNISKWYVIEKAALESGLDPSLLLIEIIHSGRKLLDDDLKIAEVLEIKTFPTLIFLKDGEIVHKSIGYKPYEEIEEIIRELIPETKKSKIVMPPESLFKLYNLLTTDEFCFLLSIENAIGEKMLAELNSKDIIENVIVKNSSFWKLKLNKQQ